MLVINQDNGGAIRYGQAKLDLESAPQSHHFLTRQDGRCEAGRAPIIPQLAQSTGLRLQKSANDAEGKLDAASHGGID